MQIAGIHASVANQKAKPPPNHVHAAFFGDATRATTSNGASAAAMDAVSLNGGNDAVNSAALSRAAPAAGMCFLILTGEYYNTSTAVSGS